MTTDYGDRIRASWADFETLHRELLELAVVAADLDEGAAAALLSRLIGHIQFSGLQLRADPARPTLINAQYPPWNWGHSNPDTLYLTAVVDDAHDYRVYGTLGSVAQTTFGCYAGKSDQSEAVKVTADDLVVGDDGSFEIYFTRERQGDNWFAPPPGAESFACYQTFGDWQHQRKGTIRIECLNEVPAVGPRSFAAAADAFEQHLSASRELFTMWVKDIPARVFANLPPNFAIPPMQPPSAMAGAWFSPIPWRLADDQALVIDYQVPPGSPYVGICLTNRWGEMIDPDTRQTSLNQAQSAIDDGSVRILLANNDFGVHNWLDARGYRSGIATWRASYPTAPPGPVVTVISVEEIDDYFDPGRRITDRQRADALTERRRHFAERETP